MRYARLVTMLASLFSSAQTRRGFAHVGAALGLLALLVACYMALATAMKRLYGKVHGELL